MLQLLWLTSSCQGLIFKHITISILPFKIIICQAFFFILIIKKYSNIKLAISKQVLWLKILFLLILQAVTISDGKDDNFKEAVVHTEFG